jgi:KaiC/GvpD/RAD55 family RecA-like ATPase
VRDAPLRVPLLTGLIPGGLPWGSILLVEFEASSLWYEASFTLSAQALEAGIPTDYHVFQRTPEDVTRALERMGISFPAARRRGLFRIFDSFSAQTGLRRPTLERPYGFVSQGLRLRDWKVGALGVLRDPHERNRLHIDDNDSLLATANSEPEILDFFQSRAFAGAREKGLTFLHGFTVGTHSERFLRRLEALADGILDFACLERHGRLEQVARVRVLRGTSHDSRWRILGVSRRGVVQVRGVSGQALAQGTRIEEQDVRAAHPPRLDDLVAKSSWPVLEFLTEAFLNDQSLGQRELEDAGWRSLSQIAQETKVSHSSLYPRAGVTSPTIRELEAHGLIETRLKSGSRGRGGVAALFRIAYENPGVQSRIRELQRMS